MSTLTDISKGHYDAVADVRRRIVAILDASFGENYVFVLAYDRDPDAAMAAWNKRIGRLSTENLKKFQKMLTALDRAVHDLHTTAGSYADELFAQKDAAILSMSGDVVRLATESAGRQMQALEATKAARADMDRQIKKNRKARRGKARA